MEETLRRYLTETLLEPVQIKPYSTSVFPYFLLDIYRFFELKIYGQRFIAMYLNPASGIPTSSSPANIAKHITLCTEKAGVPCIYVAEAVTAYNRERLIRQRVQFVVPGNQMFLPSLGIDLREYMRKVQQQEKIETLKPAGQATILFLLIHQRKGEYHITDLAAEIGYTKMTISRVIEELEKTNLVRAEERGRAKIVSLNGEPKTVWHKALPMLETPVKRIYQVNVTEVPWNFVRSGETALAHFSNLNEPRRQVVAMTSEQWKSGRLKETPDGQLEIEIWRYEPRHFHVNNYAHPLTLYLRFREHKDERVQMAVEEMMKEYAW